MVPPRVDRCEWMDTPAHLLSCTGGRRVTTCVYISAGRMGLQQGETLQDMLRVFEAHPVYRGLSQPCRRWGRAALGKDHPSALVSEAERHCGCAVLFQRWRAGSFLAVPHGAQCCALTP